MAKHGIAESTKLHGCMNVSFVATEDVSLPYEITLLSNLKPQTSKI